MPTLRDYQALVESRSIEELLAACLVVAHKFDFGLLSGMLVIGLPEHATKFVCFGNIPAGYAQSYHEPTEYRRDPVLQQMKQSLLPIVWNQSTYVNSGAADLWEIQAPFEYRNGVCVASRTTTAQHFSIGMDRAANLPSNQRQLAHILAHLQLLAAHAQEAATRLLMPPEGSGHKPLTRREIDVLHWTMLGKDAQAVADILGVSRRTAKFHIENAIAKLDCETKHAAVLKALHRGLLVRNQVPSLLTVGPPPHSPD